jgi:hypothetical protein
MQRSTNTQEPSSQWEQCVGLCEFTVRTDTERRVHELPLLFLSFSSLLFLVVAVVAAAAVAICIGVFGGDTARSLVDSSIWAVLG